jgi:hypothetical protein
MIRGRSLEKRLEIFERDAKPKQGRPVHRASFVDDAEPTGLPPGATVHRTIFVDPPARQRGDGSLPIFVDIVPRLR